MCGIVGYMGPKSPKEVIINGLKKLEYRGYDSAGVSILDEGEFKRVRASGKLIALENKLKGISFSGHTGIGHTRWATHGEPTERNAHPHSVEHISLVHNGIIENYLEIREELIQQGIEIQSDTDSELVAHLIYQLYEKNPDLRQAVVDVIPHLRGAYSIVVVSSKEPDIMVAFKDGPPLVVGIGEGQALVASDVQAIIEYTNKIVYLNDQEVVEIKKSEVSFFSANGFPIEKKAIEVNWTTEQAQKHGFKHFMLKEIFEQPRAVAAAMEPHISVKDHTVQLKNVGFSAGSTHELEALDSTKDAQATDEVFKNIDRIFILACGTSYYAAMVAEYLIERLARIPVEVDIASEFRYRDPVIPKGSLVITVSQSGETADTLAVLRQAKEAGAKVLSICNVKHSTIDREAHGHLYLNAGPEIGVASTKAFTATLTIFHLLATYLGKVRGLVSKEQEVELVQALVAAPSHMESVLSYDKFFNETAQDLKTFRGFLYLGRGVSYPIALEGALKLKELAYVHAEGYAAGEMKHGPLALLDERMIVVVMIPKDKHYEKTLSNLEEARARGGKIIAIGTGDNEELKRSCRHYLSMPSAHWTINPILEVICAQLLSYHMADALGHDVDQPRNLAKSVTVE